MSPCRGCHVLRQENNLANFSQAGDDLQVFHQGLIWITSDGLEAACTNEICLVTSEECANARSEVCRECHQSVGPEVTVETDAECSCDDLWRGECLLNSSESVIRELGIGVQENKHIATCNGCTCIHLGSTPARRTEYLSIFHSYSHSSISAAAIDDEYFAIMVGALAGEAFKLILQHCFFVQHWHNDREAHRCIASCEIIVCILDR